MCHNLRFTGSRHAQWHGELKPCCMRGDNEDWLRVLSCKSLHAELIRAESWSKLIKGMEKWGMSQDMWLIIENGVRHYTMNPKKREHDNMPAEPSSPFGPTFYAPRNRLKVQRPSKFYTHLKYFSFYFARPAHPGSYYCFK
jgi:hypothetical protein